ncbi:ANL family adenylate-forming protein [Psychrobacter immobilis]|uniref:ANL family adenylate-forming protein n=1 Tax=Psychrobacter immobilis TaxID=498 RepID=UPI00191ACDAA|nr:class I adenylate-forming enzyme family protein [Psychrobacter immobilis]
MDLLELLDNVSDSQNIWITEKDILSAGQIKTKVNALKSHNAELAGKRIIIEMSNQTDALIWMIALDKLAKSVFLVPESLKSSKDYPQLKEVFNPDVIVNDNDLSIELDKFSEKFENNDSDTSWVIATSGTTGTPKLIEHTTLSLTKTCKKNTERGNEFIWGLVFDPFRFAGLQVVLQALSSGSTLVFSNKIYDVSEQVVFMQRNSVNSLSATPTYWRRLLMSGALSKAILNLRQITLGGEAADEPTLRGLRKVFPDARISHIYASTEAGVGFTVKDGLAGFPVNYLESGFGNVSLAISGQNTLLINPGKYIPSDRTGKVVMSQDGYIDTGDIVKVEGDRIYFMGRDSGTINVGGNKVMPEEVESVIRQLDEIEEVVVKPKSSGMMGQLVSAEIILKHGVEKKTFRVKLMDHCRQNLESYKVPALLRFIDDVNINSTGKINRR